MMFVSVFFFKQKTAYEMRISDWSSDVGSSDLARREAGRAHRDELLGDELLRVETRERTRPHANRQIDAVQGKVDLQERRVQRDRDVGEIGRASCRERVCQYV